jgi:hypothetical protein
LDDVAPGWGSFTVAPTMLKSDMVGVVEGGVDLHLPGSGALLRKMGPPLRRFPFRNPILTGVPVVWMTCVYIPTLSLNNVQELMWSEPLVEAGWCGHFVAPWQEKW